MGACYQHISKIMCNLDK